MKRFILCTVALVTIGFSTPQASADGTGPSDIVAGWYKHFLGRKADEAGLREWTQHLLDGMPVLEAQAAFLASGEYYQRQGGRPETFLQGLFYDVLGRTANRQDLREQLASLRTFGNRQAYILAYLQNAQAELATRKLAPRTRPLPPPPPPEESYLPPIRRR